MPRSAPFDEGSKSCSHGEKTSWIRFVVVLYLSIATEATETLCPSYFQSHDFKRSESLQTCVEITDMSQYFATGLNNFATKILCEMCTGFHYATNTRISDAGVSILRSSHHQVVACARTGNNRTNLWGYRRQHARCWECHCIQSCAHTWHSRSLFLAHSALEYNGKPLEIIQNLLGENRTYSKYLRAT